MSDKSPDDFLLEEYKFLCNESDSQRKARDYTTVLALTVGLSILGYAIQSNSSLVLLYVLPLLVFLVRYVNYVTRNLFAIKADTYIRYFIEARRTELSWFTIHPRFYIGPIYQINRALVSSIFVAAVVGNLYYIYIKGGWLYFIPSMLITLVLTGIAGASYFLQTHEGFVKQWESIEARSHDQEHGD